MYHSPFVEVKRRFEDDHKSNDSRFQKLGRDVKKGERFDGVDKNGT
jgi:hypothetical protein